MSKLLALGVFFALFMLIASADENDTLGNSIEANITESPESAINDVSQPVLAEESLASTEQIEIAENQIEKNKALSAGFGVYLEIVG